MFAYNIFHSPNLGMNPPLSLCSEENQNYLLMLRLIQTSKLQAHSKIIITLLTKKVGFIYRNVAEFQNEMIGTFEQGQGIFSIQQWRFGLFNFSLNIPAAYIFEKVRCQLCRNFGNIQNCRPT